MLVQGGRESVRIVDIEEAAFTALDSEPIAEELLRLEEALKEAIGVDALEGGGLTLSQDGHGSRPGKEHAHNLCRDRCLDPVHSEHVERAGVAPLDDGRNGIRWEGLQVRTSGLQCCITCNEPASFPVGGSPAAPFEGLC